jgi:hypothetical protein
MAKAAQLAGLPGMGDAAVAGSVAGSAAALLPASRSSLALSLSLSLLASSSMAGLRDWRQRLGFHTISLRRAPTPWLSCIRPQDSASRFTCGSTSATNSLPAGQRRTGQARLCGWLLGACPKHPTCKAPPPV